MKQRLFVVLLALILLSIGCQSISPTVLSEVVKLKPLPRKKNYFIKHSIYSNYFGVGLRDGYSYVYGALNILRVTMLEAKNFYIFEIQTDGNIELARKEYGNRMQFAVEVNDTIILTTGAVEEAAWVSIPKRINVSIVLTKKTIIKSACVTSKYELKGRSKVEIDKDCLRIYVPKEWVKASKIWCIGDPRFGWIVDANLALSPVIPIPTNISDVFFLPEIDSLTNIKASTYDPTKIWWDVKHIEENRKKEQTNGSNGEEKR